MNQNKTFFIYGQKEMDYLKRKDKKLGAVIERIGSIERETKPDPFTALISSIVSQQISSKAADTVWNRLCKLIHGEGNLVTITPETIVQVDLSAIKACGMSERKASYIKGIAEAALSGFVDFQHLDRLSDHEIIAKLSSLKGVGVWTVEMLLIFSLNRLDILSYKDLAICRGLMKLYGLNELTKDTFERYRKRYSPYGSVASLYLWALSIE